MTLAEAYLRGVSALEAAGVPDAAFDCGCLIASFCGYTHAQRIAHASDRLSETAARDFLEAVRRRADGEPLQYILGEWPFFGRAFLVGPGVLIPRPETELLVEYALAAVCARQAPVVWDLCAGTGCIGLTLALKKPDAQVFLLEKYLDAFAYLEKNRAALHASNATLVQADILEGAPALPAPDLIVSNPPYVPSGELCALQKEVRREPSSALDGGADGLAFYRALAQRWIPALKKGGTLLVECGDGQGAGVAALFEAPARSVRVRYDGNRIDRFVEVTV